MRVENNISAVSTSSKASGTRCLLAF